MNIYYVKVKDKKKLVLLLSSKTSKEELKNKVLQRYVLGTSAKSDLEHGEIHTSEEILCRRIKGRGRVSAEPDGKLQRCYGGERVILYADGHFEVIPTFFSRIRHRLLVWGWIK